MGEYVGLGFRPTNDELVGYFIPNKIQGNTWLVEWAINEVDICKFDPWNLRYQSKIKSKDCMWYFFSRRATGDRQNRKTPSGKWKVTGEPVDVKDKVGTWCGIRGKKIGHKRFLVFLNSGNRIDPNWVIHEYHNTVVLPEHLRTTYVICRLEYKGDDMSILSANAIDPTPSFVANMTNSEGPGRIWDYEVDGNAEIMPTERAFMQENRNVYIPKTPVTGFFTDDSYNSDADSMIGSNNSSGTDSVGDLIEPYHTPIDDIPSLYTIQPLHNFEAQEQQKLHLQGKEKMKNTQESECEGEMAEDSIKKTPSTKTVKQKWIFLEEISQRNSQWIIIGFLLFISVIGSIILV